MTLIKHHVAQITQPQGSNDCWAAVIAMLIGRHSAAGTEHVKSVVRSRAGSYIQANGTLNPSSVRQVASIFGFRTQSFGLERDLTVPLLEQYLRNSACGVFGLMDFAGAQSLNHAMVINGINIRNRGSESDTLVYYIDPFLGSLDFSSFENYFSSVHTDYIIYR